MSRNHPSYKDDQFDLERFVVAQQNIYPRAIAEIETGQKVSHWMWFIYPQLRGLGRSYKSQFYGISSLAEARAYLSHEILGTRLRQCVSALLNLNGRTAFEIFGEVDEKKLSSSLTLFRMASNEAIFTEALDKYFGGQNDESTLVILEQSG